MRTNVSAILTVTTLRLLTLPLAARQAPAPQGATQAPAAAAAQTPAKPSPKETEVWEPVPPIVTPGTTNSAAPSDAIILFDGTNLDQWVSTKDKSPAGWTVADGVLTVKKTAGNIETKRSFKNYQLHLEWRIPPDI